MITLEFHFPVGRYHATPWDHHANEGVVEWPPSPWRIVRALVAASFKLYPPAAEDDVQRVLAPLLGPPRYEVPAVSAGHTRHYMPAPSTTTKILDAFVVPGDQPLKVSWPAAELEGADRQLLERIIAHLTYLGRAESWVEARLTRDEVSVNCRPCLPEEATVGLLAVDDAERHRAWCDGFVAAQLGLPKKERREVPRDWWHVVQQDVGRLRDEGWSRPPGVQRVPYRFDKHTPARRAPRRQVGDAPVLARYELWSPVRPSLTLALDIGDRVRAALIKHSDGDAVFAGHAGPGQTLDHQHAYFLPADEDGDGKLDAIVLYCHRGFDAAARRAIERLQRLWGRDGHDLQLTLVAMWKAHELEKIGGSQRSARDGRLPQLGPARVWRSHTPFVPPRFQHNRGGRVTDSPEEQLVRFLTGQGLPVPEVARIDAPSLARTSQRIDWFRFRMQRQHGGGSGAGNRGCGYELRFAEPVLGPIAMGYGAHQGLGQFMAVE